MEFHSVGLFRPIRQEAKAILLSAHTVWANFHICLLALVIDIVEAKLFNRYGLTGFLR